MTVRELSLEQANALSLLRSLYVLPDSMIEREQVLKVANLARLQLTPAEEEQFTTQLGNILDYFEQLSELDTSAVEPTARAIYVVNVTRSDQMVVCEQREVILSSAPEREDEFFRVPQIMGGDS